MPNFGFGTPAKSKRYDVKGARAASESEVLDSSTSSKKSHNFKLFNIKGKRKGSSSTALDAPPNAHNADISLESQSVDVALTPVIQKDHHHRHMFPKWLRNLFSASSSASSRKTSNSLNLEADVNATISSDSHVHGAANLDACGFSDVDLGAPSATVTADVVAPNVKMESPSKKESGFKLGGLFSKKSEAETGISGGVDMTVSDKVKSPTLSFNAESGVATGVSADASADASSAAEGAAHGASDVSASAHITSPSLSISASIGFSS